MRKFTAFFLILVFLSGLAGCTPETDNQANKPNYSLEDILLYQAHSLARLIAMSAETSYLQALETPQQYIAPAEVFTTAINGQVVSGKLLKTVSEDFQTRVLTIMNTMGLTNLATCSTLAKTARLRFPKSLTAPMAVYLRFSDECHFVVHCTPTENDIVYVWAYPMFADAAERVLAYFFSNAEDLTGDEIRSSCKKGAKAKFEAAHPGQPVNASRYISIAKSLLGTENLVNPETLSLYLTDEELLTQALTVAQCLSNGIGEVEVYQFPDEVRSHIESILSQTAYPQQLEDYTGQRCYLSIPNQFVNPYGSQWMKINAVLTVCLNNPTPDMFAEKEEEPVLVLMEVGDSFSLLLSIYPTRYHTYIYAFSVLPEPIEKIRHNLLDSGAIPMQ